MKKLNKKAKIGIGIVIFVVYSILLYQFAANPTSVISNKTNDPYLSRFIENYNTLKQNWYFFKSEEEVINSATQAMMQSNLENDRYIEYIPAQNSKEYFEAMDSNYVGLGVRYLMTREYPLVSQVFNGSPAALAGIKPGDYISKVNGKSLKGLKVEEIQKIVQGKENEERKITIIRNNKEQVLNITLKKIDSSVHYQIIDNTGYLELDEFSKTSAKEVEKALKLFNEKKINKVVIDLRDNPGGYLDALQEIADLFLKENNVIIGTKDKKGNVQYYKTVDKNSYDKDLIILANNNSASASEALIACLNENSNVPIYGETTFGKGIMQGYFEYDDGGYLKYTNAEWLTPKGNAINKKGIKPTKKIDKSSIFKASELAYNFEKDILYNTVNQNLVSYQKALKALGYNVDREDGYYSPKTKSAIEKFKNDNKINEKDLGKNTQAKIVETVIKEKSERKNDNVLNQALK